MTPLEINKKIAELKGLTDWEMREYTVSRNRIETEHCSFLSPQRWDGGSQMIRLKREWSESISDAWELFEEMSDVKYLEYVLSKEHSSKHNKSYWEVSEIFRNDDNIEISPVANSDTAPLAICKAYIKWKELNSSEEK